MTTEVRWCDPTTNCMSSNCCLDHSKLGVWRFPTCPDCPDVGSGCAAPLRLLMQTHVRVLTCLCQCSTQQMQRPSSIVIQSPLLFEFLLLCCCILGRCDTLLLLGTARLDSSWVDGKEEEERKLDEAEMWACERTSVQAEGQHLHGRSIATPAKLWGVSHVC
jgi:hypothetical protein